MKTALAGEARVTQMPYEITALEENLWAQWSQFGVPEGCDFLRDGGVYQLQTPIATFPYNGVFRFIEAQDVDAKIDAIIAAYDARQVDHFWVVHPTAQPADLDRRLRDRGFEEVEVCPGMVTTPAGLIANSPPPPDIIFVPIGPEEEGPTTEFVTHRWSVPPQDRALITRFFRENRIGHAGVPLRGWLALLDGKAVGKAFTYRKDNVVGLYGVATREEARGRGVGQTICEHALRESCGAGIDLLVLHSTPMAVTLYEKLGFRHVAPFRIFSRAGEVHL